MINTFLRDNVDEERIELEKHRQDLELRNQERVIELEEKKRMEREILEKGQSAVNEMAAK